MRLTVDAEKYFVNNRRQSRTEGALLMLAGIIILVVLAFGVYILWKQLSVINIFEDENVTTREELVQQMKQECRSQCLNDYGTPLGFYKNKPDVPVRAILQQTGYNTHRCDCQDATGYGGWTQDYEITTTYS